MFFLLSHLVWSQIWLNFIMDDRHFSYITKIEKKQKKKKQNSPWNFRLPAMGGERGSSSSSSSRALAADERASLRCSFVSCCFSAVCPFVCALRARSVVPLILLATRYLFVVFCSAGGRGEREKESGDFFFPTSCCDGAYFHQAVSEALLQAGDAHSHGRSRRRW